VSEPTHTVLDDVLDERLRQEAKWGEQNHPDGTEASDSRIRFAEKCKQHCHEEARAGTLTWLDILQEEVAEARAESDPSKLRAELVQVAAVAVTWIEAIDRRDLRVAVTPKGRDALVKA
jgi:hypothetical protein